MIQMLSAFDLKAGESEEAFREAYAAFVAELKSADLIVASGSVGRRVTETPMDTDDRSHAYYSVLSFRDRAQLDQAYAHIKSRLRPATGTHLDMYRRLSNSVFTCWEEDDEG